MILRNWCLTLTMLTGLAATALGSGFHTGEYHTAYVGQATAGITMTENAGIVATLPAGMVRMSEGMHALGGATYFASDFNYTDRTSGESGGTVTDPIIGPHAYGVYNNGSYAVGLGMYFPFNVDIEYDESWAGRDLIIKEELVIGYSALVGAYSLTDTFSLGAGVNFIDAWVQLQQIQILGGDTEIPVTLGGTGSTIGYSLSLLYDNGNLAAGVNHSPEYTVTGEGQVQFDTSQAPGFTGAFPDGPISVDLSLPSLTEIGLSYRDRPLDPDYFVEFTLLQTGWSNYEELRIIFKTGRPQSELVQEKNWEDTVGYKLGGNYAFMRSGDVTHRLRGGIYFDQSPIPAETLDPAVPDGTGRTNYGLGYGYGSGDLLVDVAYFLIDVKDASASDDAPLAADYGGTITITSVSVGYRW